MNSLATWSASTIQRFGDFTKTHRALGAAILLGGLLASCGPKLPAPEPGAPIAPSALPHPKTGLWRWTSQAAGQKQLCLSGQALAPLGGRPGCPVTREVRTPAG